MSESIQVLAQHGRTFYLASFLLPPDRREDAARLYHFCRLVDDIADEQGDAVALAELEAELLEQRPARPLVASMLELRERRALPIDALIHLIQGVRGDLGQVAVQDDAELLQYCYRVAGTVGLMMSAVLGVKDTKALRHAVDLGIAMQLTNISRDVLEDQEMGRRYIPATRGAPKPAVAGLLAMAERYYESAQAGLPYIPLRTRPAIAVAMAVYRQIGRRLIRKGGDPMKGRTVVPMWEKLWVGGRALLTLPFTHRSPHQTTLHVALKGLPGCAS